LGSSVIFIATPDDVIAEIAKTLSSVLNTSEKASSAKGRMVFHTSGALSSEVLRPLRRPGLSIGSFHPLISISDPHAGAKALANAWFSLEGPHEAVRLGRRIVRCIGGKSFTISAKAKPLYHAAAMMASPNLTVLVDIALEMLTECGLKEARARQVLLPLIRSTVENLADQTPRQALTGTFKRGDIATVSKHIEALQSHGLRDALDAYVLLGKRSLSLSNLPKKVAEHIERTLVRASTHSTSGR
jgi:predicted short-subunit dehydrogenase-like oxidoreductase (DUF2520 family)